LTSAVLVKRGHFPAETWKMKRPAILRAEENVFTQRDGDPVVPQCSWGLVGCMTSEDTNI
jgi:hypothetical protein